MKSVYQFLPVSENLSSFVDTISIADCREPVQIESPVRPTGAIFLGFKYRGELTAAVNGIEVFPQGEHWLHIGGQLRDEETFIRYQGRVAHLVVQFKPIGAYRLLGIPGIQSTGTQLIGSGLPGWLQKLEEQLQTLVEQTPDPDAQPQLLMQHVQLALHGRVDLQRSVPEYLLKADAIIEHANGACRVNQVADQVGVSIRQLNREFTRIVGLSPKFYCRVLQINRAFHAMMSGDEAYLTDIASRAEFSDQAHFCRSFRQVLGDSPNAFLHSEEDMLFHFLARQGDS